MSIQADRQQAKKKQIIDAAMSCFVEKGFHATSTAEICKAAGMSPGNLFHYYPTKSAIIEAIVIDGQVYFEQVLNSIDETNSSIESVSLMMTRLIELYNDPEYARISIEIFAEASEILILIVFSLRMIKNLEISLQNLLLKVVIKARST